MDYNEVLARALKFLDTQDLTSYISSNERVIDILHKISDEIPYQDTELKYIDSLVEILTEDDFIDYVNRVYNKRSYEVIANYFN